MAVTPEQAKAALKAIADAVIDVVRQAGPLGCPGGTLYAALMTYGASLEQYEQFMSVLVLTGKLTKRGDLYFIAEVK